ncbi:MAG: hypothetical protein ABSF59_16565 [Candidatus Sulfotelmatobacter sp.]|jgi:hypothetical protein
MKRRDEGTCTSIYAFLCVPRVAILLTLFLTLSGHSYSANTTTAGQLEIDATKAGPRALEALTERGILRDYRFAWASMTQALEFNTSDPLEGPFTDEAKAWLQETVASQQKAGLSQRYVNQNHKLVVVFYAPEGDLIELQDNADFQRQVLDGRNTIQEEHVVARYIVLMTPSADRWVVRQLQAVPHF